jgi:hypothetical protein
MYSLRNRPEKLAKVSLFCVFLKLVQITFIFTEKVRISGAEPRRAHPAPPSPRKIGKKYDFLA